MCVCVCVCVCRPWIIWSGSAELRACRVDMESVKKAIFPLGFPACWLAFGYTLVIIS